MTRNSARGRAPLRQIVQKLVPYLLVQALLLASVFCWPALTHPFETKAAAERPAASESDVQQRFKDMVPRSRRARPARAAALRVCGRTSLARPPGGARVGQEASFRSPST